MHDYNDVGSVEEEIDLKKEKDDAPERKDDASERKEKDVPMKKEVPVKDNKVLWE